MKRKFVVGFVVLLFLLISGQAFALNSPAVSSEHGVITAMFVSDHGLILGGEYGLNSEVALIGSLGDPLNRLGVKYEMSPTFALTAGVVESSPFVGINGAVGLNQKVQGLYEGAVFMKSGAIAIFYEAGVKFDVQKNIDVRGGFIGFVGGKHDPLHLQLGVGYRF